MTDYAIKRFIRKVLGRKCKHYDCGDTSGCKGYSLQCCGYKRKEAMSNGLNS